MRNELDPSDKPLLDELHRMGSGTIPDLCAAMNVTQTAVRQRLTRLQAAGFVERKTIPTDRGRPHHAYFPTDIGLQQLGNNYGELALVLWRELSKISDPTVRESIVGSLKTTLVERYGVHVNAVTPEDRMEQLKQVLVEKGFSVEIDSTRDIPVLRENNCPYLELASNDKSICELEQAVFRDILKSDITLTKCCVDGHNCCEFELTQLSTPEMTPALSNQH
jgi:predicted ArsR family transcriptional regulator